MITSLITSRNRYFIANKRRLIRANVKRIENSLQNYRYFCLDVQTIVTICTISVRNYRLRRYV